MKNEREKTAPDESLRRLGGILASPSLVTSYEHTTPLLERAFLRRLGLSRDEADLFLEKMCRHGLLDRGARPLVAEICAETGLSGGEAARLLLTNDERWPEEGS